MYKVGDILTVTEEMIEQMSDQQLSLGRWLTIGAKGQFYPQRLSRDHGHMAIRWLEGWECEFGDGTTNVYDLRDIGIEIEEPEFEAMSVLTCPVKYLNAFELLRS